MIIFPVLFFALVAKLVELRPRNLVVVVLSPVHCSSSVTFSSTVCFVNSFDDLQNTEKEQFNSLCNKAYTSLLREEYSFYDPNMPTLGLMQSVQSFVVRGKSTQHYFLHLSLQELCAARHFISLPTDEQLSRTVP